MEKHMKCFVRTCKNDSKNSSKTIVKIREDLRKAWCREANVEYFQCYTQYCCEDHFDPEQDLINIYFKSENKEPRLKPTAKLRNIGVNLQEVSTGLQPEESELGKLLLISEPEPKKRKHTEINKPSTSGVISPPFKVSEQEQEAQPGPSTTVTVLSTRTSLDSNNSNASREQEQDPLSGTIEQCRFCGEFSKDCITVSGSMPYLAANKTTLALNDTSVQLDFNNHSLPSTVCRDCDAKLQEIADFLTVVKAAQDTLIHVAEEREVGETRVEYEVDKLDVIEETEIDTLVIKTEDDSQDEEGDDEKEGYVDYLTVGETIFVKKSTTYKRKSDAVTAKPKKHKAKECDSELIVDIKEEVIEKEDGQGQSEISDSDVKPSELEQATSALMFEMAGDGAMNIRVIRVTDKKTMPSSKI